MKLSKAQQEVVDKMREGYVFNGYAFVKGNDAFLVDKQTLPALMKKEVIEWIGNGSYDLTEQYKNERK